MKKSIGCRTQVGTEVSHLTEHHHHASDHFRTFKFTIQKIPTPSPLTINSSSWVPFKFSFILLHKTMPYLQVDSDGLESSRSESRSSHFGLV